jgi:hypothetical protein
VDWVIKILGALGGLAGTSLGIYNFVHARRQERRANAAEEKDWEMFLRLRADMLGTNNAYVPEEGSAEHRSAERMVAKGWLQRSAEGAYYEITRGK